MQLLLAILLITSVGSNEDDAEKLVRSMEKKISTAKTLQISFEGEVEGEDRFGTLKGTLTVAAKNKILLDGVLWKEDKKNADKWRIVSDGAHMRTEGPQLFDITQPASKKLTENYRSTMTHGGYHMMLFVAPKLSSEDYPLIRASAFKLERKEKLGEREAYVISCKLAPREKDKDDKPNWSETLWLDTETNLPLKRVVSRTHDGPTTTFTETYSRFLLDPKIDTKLFELSK